jgi:hypothetical protein
MFGFTVIKRVDVQPGFALAHEAEPRAAEINSDAAMRADRHASVDRELPSSSRNFAA